MYADVLILNHDSNYDQILTYLIPLKLRIEEGYLVIVPLRNTRRKGLVLSTSQEAPAIKDLRNIEKAVEDHPVVTREGLALARWLSNYYVCSINKALQPFLPPPVRMVSKNVLQICEGEVTEQLFQSELEKELLRYLKTSKAVLSRKEIIKKFGPPGEDALKQLLAQKVVREKVLFKSQVSAKLLHSVSICSEAPEPENIMKKAPRQGLILSNLLDGPVTKDTLKQRLGEIDAPLRALVEKGWVAVSSESDRRKPYTITLNAQRPDYLNNEQLAAIKKISAGIKGNTFKEWLLYGVTGSGKTEVYLKSIEETLAAGKQALYLVPEISLTPQIISVLLSVFGDKAALLHSSLSLGERFDEWMRIRSGEAQVIVGPRSALFAPFTKLGLIIIDEEHENTYKQNEPDPRYDARTTAVELARLYKAVLLMGSATPSLKSFYQAQKGSREILSLPERIEKRPLPEIEIVDMRKELQEGNKSIFSKLLVSSLEQVFARGEQAIIFINRRGYHTFVLCRECGKALICPNCSITLTYHQARGKLICHYCNYSRALPTNCPACGSRYIRYFGSGTERVAREMEALFPEVRYLRMDSDTTRLKGSHTEILKEFQEGKSQVLIGTQMIAKGLDFPGVTLVGIVNPDTILNMPDYQASERAYQLITQVAGRAGRGSLAGRVLLQTYNPDHYLFDAIIRQDYEEFFRQEIANREMLQYPPYQSLARILVSGDQEKKVRERVDYLSELLKIEIDKKGLPVEVLGPSQAPLFFLKGRYRYHFTLRGQDLNQIRDLAWIIRNESRKLSPEPRIIIDIEPQSLL